MTATEEFFKEHYAWKAAKETHREKTLQLRRKANKEFSSKHPKWFKTLDTLGLIIIALNMVALIITGLLVVRAEPDKSFVEANPSQCEWNGFACHDDGWSILLPILKQIAIWTVLVALYLYIRTHTFSYMGMLILTGIIIFYAMFIGWDTFHDIGLYLGKIIYGAT